MASGLLLRAAPVPRSPQRPSRRRAAAVLVVLLLATTACEAADVDDDGLTSEEELALGTDPHVRDTDGDGFSDGLEHRIGLDPLSGDAFAGPDGDGDGALDSLEAAIGTDPGLADTDGDGLDDGEELFLHETHPGSYDTDGDGFSDGVEIDEIGSDPLRTDSDGDGLADATEVQVLGTDPTSADTDDDGTADGFEDTDADALVDLREVLLGTDPLAPDTDGDGLLDGPEVDLHHTDPLDDDTDHDNDFFFERYLRDGEEVNVYGTDPTDPDTDDDGLRDSSEVARGFDPLDPDTDHDGLDDFAELMTHHTTASDPDTDDDGLDDGFEVRWGLDPLDPLVLTGPDADDDGLPDAIEAQVGTDPDDPDADDDGLDDDELLDPGTSPFDEDADGDLLLDGAEVAAGTDPFDADTDGDRLPDGLEVRGAGDPVVVDADGGGDADADTIGAVFEAALGTDPGLADSDADGVADGEELDLAGDPLSPDGDADGLVDLAEVSLGSRLGDIDTDADRLDDPTEQRLGTRPDLEDSDSDGIVDALQDTDDDGLGNLDELGRGTDPTLADTDGDGLLDGFEALNGGDPLTSGAVTTVFDDLTVDSTPSGTPVERSIGANGGIVEVTAADGISYRLVVPPDALAAPTLITMTPTTITGTAAVATGTVGAVDLEPSGLTFAVPAHLVVRSKVDAPFDALGKGAIQWRADGSAEVVPVEVHPSGRYATMEVSHFSGAGALTLRTSAYRDAVMAGMRSAPDVQAVAPNLPALVAGLPGTQAELDDLFHAIYTAMVETLFPAADDSVEDLISARTAFTRWAALAQVAGADIEAQQTQGQQDLAAAASALSNRYQQPDCSGPVDDPYDWLVYSVQLAAIEQLLGGDGVPVPCATIDVTVAAFPEDIADEQLISVEMDMGLFDPGGTLMENVPGEYVVTVAGGTIAGSATAVVTSDVAGHATVTIDRGDLLTAPDTIDIQVEATPGGIAANEPSLGLDDLVHRQLVLSEADRISTGRDTYAIEIHDWSGNPSPMTLIQTDVSVHLEVGGVLNSTTGELVLRFDGASFFQYHTLHIDDPDNPAEQGSCDLATRSQAFSGGTSTVTFTLEELLSMGSSGAYQIVQPPSSLFSTCAAVFVRVDPTFVYVKNLVVLGGGSYRMMVEVGLPSIGSARFTLTLHET